ncbi:hypothetical protein BJY04DRAFT_218988 [Aspergillus karnatakaensis]|uniref:uncharacterized protein n=1 Tax=Aspergillus karnatakaensis TaxID=1810916 RepID=UPI003CCDACE7
MSSLYPFKPYVLTPLDHYMVPAVILRTISFKPHSHAKAIARLAQALEALTEHFPYLSGNIVPSKQLASKTNVFEVQPATAEFLVELPMLQVKEHSRRISEIVTGQPPLSSSINYDSIFRNDEFLLFPRSMVMTDFSPLLRMQVNLIQSILILTIAVNHRAMDGIGTSIIYQMLANFCQTPRLIPDAVQLHPTTAYQTSCRKNIFSMIANHRKDWLRSTNSRGTRRNPTCVSPETDTTFIESKVQVDNRTVHQLRHACARYIPDIPEEQTSIPTLNETITALLWLCRARSLSRIACSSSSSRRDNPSCSQGKTDFHFCSLIDLRTRELCPPIPRSYVGNAFFLVSTTCKLPDGVETTSPSDSIKLVAYLVRELQRNVELADENYIGAFFAKCASEVAWVSTLPGFDFAVSNIRHLRLATLDFGEQLGRSVDGGDSRALMVSRAAWILPSRNGELDAPYEIRVCLEAEEMAAFLKDPLLQEAISGHLGL